MYAHDASPSLLRVTDLTAPTLDVVPDPQGQLGQRTRRSGVSRPGSLTSTCHLTARRSTTGTRFALSRHAIIFTRWYALDPRRPTGAFDRLGGRWISHSSCPFHHQLRTSPSQEKNLRRQDSIRAELFEGVTLFLGFSSPRAYLAPLADATVTCLPRSVSRRRV